MFTILFLSANPIGTHELRIHEEFKEIEDAIDKGKKDDQFTLRQRHKISRSDLQDYLLEFTPDIVHFSGHGSDTGRLIFVDRHGYEEDADPQALSELFEKINSGEAGTRSKRIRCVVLNACYTSELAHGIAKCVDCVIGATSEIPDFAAGMFAETFYRRISDGESVLKAFELAKSQLKINDVDASPLQLECRQGVDPSKIFFIEEEKPITTPRISPMFPRVFRHEKKIFFGRREELNRIREYFEKSNDPVSIIGEGGIGKSALAFKALHNCEDIFDIVIPIYFESDLTFDSFLLEIAKNIGLQVEEFEKNEIEVRRQLILNTLATFERAIIYADSYESVAGTIDRDSSPTREEAIRINEFLENLPANTPVLVTSRQRENLVSERIIRLDGLALEEGRDLFIKLAGSDLPENLPEEVRHIIEEIIKKIAGHPLSIELLARRYRGQGLSELRTMLEHLGVGVYNPRNEAERQRSVEQCFEYTFGSLSQRHKMLLAQLILFRSPFLASGVECIFGHDQIEILLDLHDYGLLRRIDFDKHGDIEGNYRLYLFHPVVRNYLERKVKEEELERVYGHCFSQYYAGVIEETYQGLAKKNRLLLVRRFEYLAEGENNDLDRAVVLTKDLSLAAFISSYLGLVLMSLGFHGDSFRYFKKALAIHEELQDKVEMAGDYTNICAVLNKMREYEEALNYHRKALAIHEELQDRPSMANDYRNIGIVLRSQGDHKGALNYHRKALAIHEELQDMVRMAGDYTNICAVLRSQGDHKGALSYQMSALAIHEELQDMVEMADDCGNIGILLRSQGDHKGALNYHRKALAIHEELQDRPGMARDHSNLAFTLRSQGDHKGALNYHRKALAIHEELQDKVRMADDYKHIGLLLFKIGDRKKSDESITKAKEILHEFQKKTGHQPGLMEQINDISKFLGQNEIEN